MTASADSTEDQARALADAFQKLVLRVRDKNAKIEEENDIVRAKNDVPPKLSSARCETERI